MTWLVTGGAGYVGAHVVAELRRAGESVVVLDDLSTGVRGRSAGHDLVVGSVLDAPLVARVLREHDVHGIVHLAAKKQVEESVRRPLLYYQVNVEGLRVVLQEATAAGVGAFVLSSSAAVYGAPDVPLVTEDSGCRPVNPYGTTKLVGELMLEAVAAATGLRCAVLRYFNVAGAAGGLMGDLSATSLVPMVFQRLGQGLPPRVFGDDHDTPDGTCVRDFVHVADVASAHVAAAQRLQEGGAGPLTVNIGRGEGVSVLEMVSLVRAVTGTVDQAWAAPVVHPRRPGDPPRVVASVDRARALLGWESRLGVREMVESAWASWRARGRDHPAGGTALQLGTSPAHRAQAGRSSR